MENIIDVRNLTKKFNHFVAVDNVSFQVAKGEIFGFLGPNGAGKTTTINILTTQLQPTEGTAIIDGFDVVLNPANVRRDIGIVFQDPSLDIELTAWENIKFHGMLYNI
ncbi:MAG: ATP-binding cassette domain-containing protein, partial [Patescibacteria group bacterium]